MSPASKVLGMLGLARRAGAIVPGLEATREAVRDGRARLVVLAEDASSRQLEKIERTLAGRPTPTVRFGDRAVLGRAVGTRSVSAVGVTHTAFADQIQSSVESSAVFVVSTPVEA